MQNCTLVGILDRGYFGRKLMKIFNHATLKTWTVIGLCAAISGCTVHRRHQTEPATQPTAHPMSLRQQQKHRLTSLRSAVASFQEEANALPGVDDTEHRYMMEQAFDDLNVALPILVGEEPSGAFRLQIRSIQSARDELASNPTLAPEPIEDSGIRAAVGAMGRIAHEEFYGGSERMADKLRVALRPLDRTTGPMHRLAVRDVMRQISDELRRLANIYEDHIDMHSHHKHEPMEQQ